MVKLFIYRTRTHLESQSPDSQCLSAQITFKELLHLISKDVLLLLIADVHGFHDRHRGTVVLAELNESFNVLVERVSTLDTGTFVSSWCVA